MNKKQITLIMLIIITIITATNTVCANNDTADTNIHLETGMSFAFSLLKLKRDYFLVIDTQDFDWM